MSPSDFNPAILLTAAKWAVITLGVVHIFIAFGLSMLAAKLRHGCGWLAWIPLINHFLMCRVAGVSMVIGLFTFIPGVHLFIFAYLGAAMAKRAGHSAWLGAAFGVPVFGALVPLILATGPAPASSVPADAPPARPPLATALINLGGLAAVIGLTIAGFVMASRMTKADLPSVEKAVAALPPRVAGTLTEFPIDSGTDDLAQPSRVVTQGFAVPREGQAPERGAITDEQLPPWLPAQSLPAVAENATAAEYTTASARVSVVALAMRPETRHVLPAPTPQQLAELSPEATVTGVELKSPANVTYRGYRVSSPTGSFYALQREDLTTAVLITAQDVISAVVAERLARNVGNGQGLLEQPEYRRSFSQLPPSPPNGALKHLQTFTSRDIAGFAAELEKAATEPGMDPEIASLLPMVRSLAPETCTVAMYALGGGDTESALFAGIAGYSSVSNAWAALQAVRTLQALVPPGLPFTVKGIEVGDASGFAVDANDGTVTFGAILLRRGASLALIAGPNTTSQDLRVWAENYVQAR